MNHPDHHLANTLPHPCICCAMLRFAMFQHSIVRTSIVLSFPYITPLYFIPNWWLLKSLPAVYLLYSILIYLFSNHCLMLNYLLENSNAKPRPCHMYVSLGRKYMWQMKTKLIKIHYLWNAMSGCSIAVRSNSNYLSHSVPFEKLHSASS